MSDKTAVLRKRAVEILLEAENALDAKEKLAGAGIPEAALMRWLCNPAFVSRLRAAAEARADAMLPAVWRSLVSEALKGNVSAIKLFLDKRTPESPHEADRAGALLLEQNAILSRLLSGGRGGDDG